MKKPRSDSKLAALTDEQREQLATWLLAGMGYAEARLQIRREWGISTSVAALSGFWQSEVSPRVIERRARYAETANALVETAAAANPKLDGAVRALLKQRTFEALTDPNRDPLEIARIVQRALQLEQLQAAEAERDLKQRQLDLQREQRDRDLEIRERSVRVSEERLRILQEQMDRVRNAVSEARQGGLTPEALAKIEEAAKLL